MNTKTIRSTVIATGIVLAGGLSTMPVWAQSDAADNIQQAVEMSEKGKGKAREAKEKAKEKKILSEKSDDKKKKSKNKKNKKKKDK